MAGIQPPKGTHDILPADSSAWEWLLATHDRVAAAHGYQAIETPAFEATEMFERGIGAGTDVVDKEMFSFITRGGDPVTLRPEATPASVRAVLGAHLDQELRPVRVRYAGPMFRYDRPQAGRYRQFHQVGIEAIGEGGPELDAEVVEVGWRYYEALGIGGVSLQINTLGDLEDRHRYRAALVDYFTPQRDELCEDCRRRLDINPLRLLDCKVDAGRVAEAPSIHAVLSEPSRRHFERALGLIRAAGIPATVNERLVRGLDYYAHTTFEYWHTSLKGAQNALGGGGRYDGLAEVLGFPATPGVGYALGLERALIVAREAGAAPGPAASAQVVVAAVGEEAAEACFAIARELREAGARVIVSAGPRKLDKKLRDADRAGASVCVIVGGDEVTHGTAIVRDLLNRTQESVTRASVAAHVTATLQSREGAQP